MSIMVTRPSMPSWEEYIKEIKPIFDSHYLTNSGPILNELRMQLTEYLEVPHLSMFVNGHMALEVAIQALGLRDKGGEVITTPFTFVSTTHAIQRSGLKPVFCDIKKDDYTIDTNKIEERINERTVAIIPVHVYGNVCDVEAINSIAQKYRLKVIYDAAHAFGVKYNGHGIGCFGDASIFSFHATKVFNTIEGGAVAYSNEMYCTPMHRIKDFGIHGEDVEWIGGNAKMDEFRAAMGICNLRHIQSAIDKRKRAYLTYRERLEAIEGIQLCPEQEDVESNYAYLPVYVDRELFGQNRDQLIENLKKHDIYARKYFYPATNEMSCYKQMGNQTPVAHEISQNIVTLPLYEELNIDDVHRICDIILK